MSATKILSCIIVLCICLMSVQCGVTLLENIARITPAYISTRTGVNATFKCDYSLPNANDVSYIYVNWYKETGGGTDSHIWTAGNDAPASIAVNTPQGPYSNTDTLRGSTVEYPEIAKSHSLTFINVGMEDKGLYNCFVQFVHDTNEYAAISASVMLVPELRPEVRLLDDSTSLVSEASSLTYIHENQMIYVYCICSPTKPGDDEVTLSLLIESAVMPCEKLVREPNENHTCLYEMIAVRQDNMKKLECQTTLNGHTNFSAVVPLSVDFPPSEVTMTPVIPSNSSIGSRAFLLCETDIGNPTPVITWYKDERGIEQNDSNFTICTSEPLGLYNAKSRVSIISFFVTEQNQKQKFQCKVPGVLTDVQPATDRRPFTMLAGSDIKVADAPWHKSGQNVNLVIMSIMGVLGFIMFGVIIVLSVKGWQKTRKNTKVHALAVAAAHSGDKRTDVEECDGVQQVQIISTAADWERIPGNEVLDEEYSFVRETLCEQKKPPKVQGTFGVPLNLE